MFGNPVVPKTFTLTKFLGGISKTLNVANQLIPLYNQARPLISNARNILGVLKTMNTKESGTLAITNNSEKKESASDSISYTNVNNPTFFI